MLISGEYRVLMSENRKKRIWPPRKNVSLNFRVSPEFRTAFKAAAAQTQMTQSAFLQYLLEQIQSKS